MENMMNLKVTPRTLSGGTNTNDVQALDLEGEVDVYTAPVLRQAIMDQVEGGVKHLLINLARVEYLDSTGLGILIGGVKRLKEQGGSLRLVGPSARIQRIFEITGLNKIFDVYASEQEALGTAAAAVGGS
jgi:anti-sigma B factor antagonist